VSTEKFAFCRREARLHRLASLEFYGYPGLEKSALLPQFDKDRKMADLEVDISEEADIVLKRDGNGVYTPAWWVGLDGDD
jgi:hypothetical protein